MLSCCGHGEDEAWKTMKEGEKEEKKIKGKKGKDLGEDEERI